MKVLGLLGGMTFESTALYYDIINRHVRKEMGPRCSAPLFMYSANQEQMLQYAVDGDWDAFADVYIKAAKALIAGGAEGIVICASLAHRAAETIEKSISVPLLHIADFVGLALKEKGIKKVALIGTKVVMDGNFVKGRIEKNHGVAVLVPGSVEERDEVNRGIVEELTTGSVSEKTKTMFLQAAQNLVQQGAAGLILGSTDLGFVIKEEDIGVPVFDIAKIHALGSARWVLDDAD